MHLLIFFFRLPKKQSQEFNIFKYFIAPQGACKLLGKCKNQTGHERQLVIYSVNIDVHVYSVSHNFIPPSFLLDIMVIIKILSLSLVPHKLRLI